MIKLRKFVNNNSKAFWLVACALIYFLLGRLHELATAIFLVIAVVCGLVYSIFKTYEYRKGKLKYVVFQGHNDSYSEFQAFFFSVLVLVGVCFSYYVGYITTIWLSIGLLVALLLFLSGLYTMPSGFLKVKSDGIQLNGVDDEIEIENVSTIEIYHNRIVVKSLDGKVWLASNIKIEEFNAEEIVSYLSARLLNSAIEITNQVSPVPVLKNK